MQIFGTLAYALALAALGHWPALTAEQLLYALALAAINVAALLSFYRALALGPISVVSPIGAAYLAVTVLLVVAFLGERLSVGQAVAVAVTFAGVVLVSTDLRALRATLGRPLPGVRFALVAMLGFGAWAALMAAATRAQDGLAILLVLRAVNAVLMAVVTLVRRGTPVPVSPRLIALVAAIGVLDTAGNVSYVLGVSAGFASIVVTGSGVYPIIPSVLAIAVLGERLGPSQYAGVAVVAAGLVALGLSASPPA